MICKHVEKCSMLAALSGLDKCVHAIPHKRSASCALATCPEDRHYKGTCVPIRKEESCENTES